jgi:hypothetical protein
MKILPQAVVFEWDKGNIDKNYKKHGVSDREAEEVFESAVKFIFEDEKHSLVEKRYMIWGMTGRGRKLSVFFTMRSGKIRIISARDMHHKERRRYEEKIQAASKV